MEGAPRIVNMVMDTSALVAALRREPGADLVKELLSGNECTIHVVNLCEVYYGFRRRGGEARADEALEEIESLGVATRGDLDTEFWKQVGAYKADVGGMSLADCFCAALASRVNGEIVTSDHDFDRVLEHGLCRVRFIR